LAAKKRDYLVGERPGVSILGKPEEFGRTELNFV